MNSGLNSSLINGSADEFYQKKKRNTIHLHVCNRGFMSQNTTDPVTLLRNQKADALESWYVASGAPVLPSLSWP